MNLKALKRKLATLQRQLHALTPADGTFTDASRPPFDAKKAEIAAVETQIRAIETPDEDDEDDEDPAPPDAATAERQRVLGIQQATRAAQLPTALADAHITNGTTIEAFRALVIDELVKTQPPRTDPAQAIVPGEDAIEKAIRGASQWLAIKGDVEQVLVSAAERRKEPRPTFDPGEFRGMTLLELAKHCLELRGVKTRGLDKMALVAQAFTYRATQSTSDFAVLLENVMHKTLQAQYAITPDTWTQWCARGTVSDFRAHNRYRFGMFGGLDALTQNGEFRNKAILDGEKELVTLTTKGNIINVSRQMIVNDDMGVFMRLLTMLGRAARLSEEIAAYAELAKNSNLGPTLNDTKSLFHADHNNIGTGSALAVNALDADAVLLAKQKDVNSNEFLDIQPWVLLLPRELLGDARVINDAQYDPDTANKLQKPNKVRGLFARIVGTARLSGTRRYLFADPSVAPAFEMAFLEGAAEPVIETKDGWNVDGTEMKVRHDLVCAGVDFRPAVTNAGA